MNKKILILTILFIGLGMNGCTAVAPTISKAYSEKHQLEQMVRQNEILERIAVSLEREW